MNRNQIFSIICMFVSQNINKNQTINILNTNLDTVIYLTLNNV